MEQEVKNEKSTSESETKTKVAPKLDSKFAIEVGLFKEILTNFGLPGVVVCGWMISALTGRGDYSNISMWGSVAAASIVINFILFQLKNWKDSIIMGIEHIVETSYLRTTTAVEMMVSLQQSTVKNMSILLDTQDGNLSLKQLRVLVNFICDTFKWRTWQVCLNAIDPTVFQTLNRHDLQETVDMQISSTLKQLSTYNQVMARAEVKQLLHDTVAEIFDSLYDNEGLTAEEDYVKRVQFVIAKIRDSFDTCSAKFIKVLEEYSDNI